MTRAGKASWPRSYYPEGTPWSGWEIEGWPLELPTCWAFPGGGSTFMALLPNFHLLWITQPVCCWKYKTPHTIYLWKYFLNQHQNVTPGREPITSLSAEVWCPYKTTSLGSLKSFANWSNFAIFCTQKDLPKYNAPITWKRKVLVFSRIITYFDFSKSDWEIILNIWS